MFKAYKYSFFLERIYHDFPAFALVSHTNVQMSEGTFCRVGAHMKNLSKIMLGWCLTFDAVCIYIACEVCVHVNLI